MWLGLVWAALFSLLWLWWDERTLPDIRGAWASAGCETVESADGRSHLTRALRVEDGRWSMSLRFHDDAACEKPIFAVEVGGPYDLGPKAMVPRDATTARFEIDAVALTPTSEAAVVAFEDALCGGGGWTLGEAKAVTESGCLGLVPTVRSCPVEYDIVKVERGRLFLGDRSRGLCVPERYPDRFAPHALERLEPRTP
jgi:hypothetical protein